MIPLLPSESSVFVALFFQFVMELIKLLGTDIGVICVVTCSTILHIRRKNFASLADSLWCTISVLTISLLMPVKQIIPLIYFLSAFIS